MINALIYNHLFQYQKPAQHQQPQPQQHLHHQQQLYLLEQQVCDYLIFLVSLITSCFYETLNYIALNPLTDWTGCQLWTIELKLHDLVIYFLSAGNGFFANNSLFGISCKISLIRIRSCYKVLVHTVYGGRNLCSHAFCLAAGVFTPW